MNKKIGLKKGYTAAILSDVVGAVAYGTVVEVEGLQKMDVKPNVSKADIPSDDKTETITQTNGASASVQRVDFTLAEQAEYFGYRTDASGGVYSGEQDEPTYRAVGYMRTMYGGGVRCVWLLKGKFIQGDSSADTKQKGSLSVQYDTYTFESENRNADGEWRYTKDYESEAAAEADNFFSVATLQALSSGITPDALTVTSNPADAATGVSKTAAKVLTFSNKILAEAVSIVSAAGAVVAVTKAWDATGKILSITPSSALTGSTVYIININGVKDIYGQDLAYAAIDFTTAS